MNKVSVNDPCPCGSGVKYKKCHGHPVAEKRPSTLLHAYQPIKLVRQEDDDGCSIATAAMVAGTSYRETLAAIGTLSTSEESAVIYMAREGKFLNDRGWWVSAQLVLKTVVDLETLHALIERDAKMSEAVKNSPRLRIFLAFPDGKKPDHSVIWDKDNKDVVFDPALGVLPTEQLFKLSGEQRYSGALGFMSFTFSPGMPIQTLIAQENSHKVKIDTEGLTDEQKRSAEFQSAYQDMLRQLTAPGFADVLCCHEAAHLFYFMLAGGAKNYQAFHASLRYDPLINDYSGSLASVQILDYPEMTEGKFPQYISNIARALSAGGVVARKLMADHPAHGYDTTGGDQDDKERFVRMCGQLNTKANTSVDAETLWKSAQNAVFQELSDHPEWLSAIKQLADELRPKLGL